MDSETTADQFGDDHPPRGRDANRHAVAFIVSIAAHVLILAGLVFMLPEVEGPRHEWVLAYLVDLGDSGSSGRGAGAGIARAGSPPAPAHEASDLKSQNVISNRKPHAHRRAARPQAPPVRASLLPSAVFAAVPTSTGDAPITARSADAVPPPAGTAPSGISVASANAFGAGSNGGEGGHGTGGMGAGSGASFAHAEYGHNPAPIYPVEARRRAEHGTVMLRVKVGADGYTQQVEIAQSSGFDLLDNEAIETVRSRWRFVPARRDGVAVESWCEVPIRFALTEAQAN